jgi:hypothetical protein
VCGIAGFEIEGVDVPGFRPGLRRLAERIGTLLSIEYDLRWFDRVAPTLPPNVRRDVRSPITRARSGC